MPIPVIRPTSVGMDWLKAFIWSALSVTGQDPISVGKGPVSALALKPPVPGPPSQVQPPVASAVSAPISVGSVPARLFVPRLSCRTSPPGGTSRRTTCCCRGPASSSSGPSSSCRSRPWPVERREGGRRGAGRGGGVRGDVVARGDVPVGGVCRRQRDGEELGADASVGTSPQRLFESDRKIESAST